MEKYSQLDKEMDEALEVQTFFFIAAEHFSVYQLHEVAQICFAEQAVRDVVVPE